jgi:hypothetical protein
MGKEHPLTRQAVEGRGVDNRVTEGPSVRPTPVIRDAKKNIGPPLYLILHIGLGRLKPDMSALDNTDDAGQADESN